METVPVEETSESDLAHECEAHQLGFHRKKSKATQTP